MSEASSGTGSAEGGHLSTRYWPATFEERGVVVPFTTPTLAFARVRADRNAGLEILIPGLSGSAGVYVIAWPSVSETFRMAVHDQSGRAARRERVCSTVSSRVSPYY